MNQQPGNLHGTNLGPLHTCDRCVVWSTCRTLALGAQAALGGYCKPIPHIGLLCPALMKQELLSITDMP